MDRRDTLKTLLVSSFAGGLILNGCSPGVSEAPAEVIREDYGRTPEEKDRDVELYKKQFFTERELETIALLCDLILPASATAGSATDAGVPEFIEFISKDIPQHQIPLRGGIMWLNNRSNRKYGMDFLALNDSQHKEMLDEIAYPEKASPEVAQGVSFFTLMRNLTLTGYYTTKTGIEDLGYKGNTPNVWDGVPEEVLKEHGLSYDEEWLAKCVDQGNRNELAQWDNEGKLIT
jgi:hypothetical protein